MLGGDAVMPGAEPANAAVDRLPANVMPASAIRNRFSKAIDFEMSLTGPPLKNRHRFFMMFANLSQANYSTSKKDIMREVR
ncbi:MAG TPA: hypothetical protein VF988_01600 [Verrucomicrobiae bacterium]